MTGGSSGIGKYVALDLARRGARVVIASHDAERLARAGRELLDISPDSFACAGDVSSQDDMDELAYVVHERLGGIDVLINNAGFATYRTFADSEPAELTRLIDVNLAGVVRCTRAFIPGLIEQRSGTILNVASVAGRLPLTPNGTYAAAKHGVFALSEILGAELARFGIRVFLVCPGRVQTAFFDHATFRARAHRPETEYTIPIERVSTKIIRAIETGKRVTYVPWTFGLLTWAYSAVPFIAAPAFRRLNRSRIESYYSSGPRNGEQ